MVTATAEEATERHDEDWLGFMYLREHPTASASHVREYVSQKIGRESRLQFECVSNLRRLVNDYSGAPGPIRASDLGVAKEHAAEVTTEDKRVYLRTWALGLAKGDPSSLPVIREARKAVREQFGQTLGTDIIMKDLKEMRQELTREKMGPAGTIGEVNGPGQAVTPTSIRQIVVLMRSMGIKALELDDNDEIYELRRKSS